MALHCISLNLFRLIILNLVQFVCTQYKNECGQKPYVSRWMQQTFYTSIGSLRWGFDFFHDSILLYWRIISFFEAHLHFQANEFIWSILYQHWHENTLSTSYYEAGSWLSFVLIMYVDRKLSETKLSLFRSTQLPNTYFYTKLTQLEALFSDVVSS